MELSSDCHSSIEADLYRPLFEYIRAKKLGTPSPLLIPQLKLLPLSKLAKLALLWREAGFDSQSEELSASLLKLISFPSLWSRENEFNEAQTRAVISKLRDLEPSLKKDLPFHLLLVETKGIHAALTLDGRKTSLGAIHAGAEIRAFGPQTDLEGFGIVGKGENHWAQTAAYPECWIEMKHEILDASLKLNFRFCGVDLKTPLSFAFYVKADSCQIKNQLFKPKSLARFSGETDQILFNQKLKLVLDHPAKSQVIPLAGDGYFWGCDFLFIFELNPFISSTSISIHNLSID